LLVDGFGMILYADAIGELTIAGSSPCLWPYGVP
jgi:hypothetical protein